MTGTNICPECDHEQETEVDRAGYYDITCDGCEHDYNDLIDGREDDPRGYYDDEDGGRA